MVVFGQDHKIKRDIYNPMFAIEIFRGITFNLISNVVLNPGSDSEKKLYHQMVRLCPEQIVLNKKRGKK